jgi:hypothetical protein
MPALAQVQLHSVHPQGHDEITYRTIEKRERLRLITRILQRTRPYKYLPALCCTVEMWLWAMPALAQVQLHSVHPQGHDEITYSFNVPDNTIGDIETIGDLVVPLRMNAVKLNLGQGRHGPKPRVILKGTTRSPIVSMSPIILLNRARAPYTSR